MAADKIYLTPEGHDKLRQELEYLKTVRRRELSAAIEQARAFGDISENAEYDSAKNAQALNEKRIVELEDALGGAQIIDNKDVVTDQIFLGTTVELKDLDSKEIIQYTVVSEIEADFSQGKISADSPIGKAIFGHKTGEIVEITVPAGTLKYKITKISR